MQIRYSEYPVGNSGKAIFNVKNLFGCNAIIYR